MTNYSLGEFHAHPNSASHFSSLVSSGGKHPKFSLFGFPGQLPLSPIPSFPSSDPSVARSPFLPSLFPSLPPAAPSLPWVPSLPPQADQGPWPLWSYSILSFCHHSSGHTRLQLSPPSHTVPGCGPCGTGAQLIYLVASASRLTKCTRVI